MWRNFTNEPQGKATARLPALPAEPRMMSEMAAAAAPSPDLIHPGVLKYLRETGVMK